jgi:hypothetical protein
VDAEAETVDLEAHLDLVAGAVAGRLAAMGRTAMAGRFAGLDEATVEAEIEDAAFAQVPVLNMELDGAVAGVARAAAPIVAFFEDELRVSNACVLRGLRCFSVANAGIGIRGRKADSSAAPLTVRL